MNICERCANSSDIFEWIDDYDLIPHTMNSFSDFLHKSLGSLLDWIPFAILRNSRNIRDELLLHHCVLTNCNLDSELYGKVLIYHDGHLKKFHRDISLQEVIRILESDNPSNLLHTLHESDHLV